MILGSYICGKRVLHANMTELWSLWALTVFAFGSCLAEADLVQCQLVQALAGHGRRCSGSRAEPRQ